MLSLAERVMAFTDLIVQYEWRLAYLSSLRDAGVKRKTSHQLQYQLPTKLKWVSEPLPELQRRITSSK